MAPFIMLLREDGEGCLNVLQMQRRIEWLFQPHGRAAVRPMSRLRPHMLPEAAGIIRSALLREVVMLRTVAFAIFKEL